MASNCHIINLRKLLSLNLDNTEYITRSIRVRLQHLSYEISFYLNGDSVCLTGIRPIHKQPPLNQRIQKRVRTLESLYRQRAVETGKQEPRPEVEDALQPQRKVDAESQTAVRRFRSTASMTEQVPTFQRHQQTLHTLLRNSECQTDCCTASVGIQTELAYATHPTQTEQLQNSTAAQTELLQYNCATQTAEQQEAFEPDEKEEEFNPVLFVTTRIGGMVVHSHDLLCKHLALLRQIATMTSLSERTARQMTALNIAREMRKQKEAREYFRARAKWRAHYASQKRFPVEKLSTFVQTDQRLHMTVTVGIHIPTLEKFTQTAHHCTSLDATSQTDANLAKTKKKRLSLF